ncbi:MAG: hydrogenase maturation protease [Methanocellales archaeon]
MIKIIGLGDILKCDDGFGIYVLGELMKHELPSNVLLIDGGKGEIEIANYLEGADKIIIIDAVSSGDTPGRIFRFSLDQFQACDCSAYFLHYINLHQTLEIGKTKPLPEIVFYGVEIQKVEEGMALSPEVYEALQKVVGLILSELGVSLYSI